MAYQKLQLALAADVIKSDTIDIPLESSSQITGESDAGVANKLTDAAIDFTAIQGLVNGAIIVNVTDGTIATVTAIDSAHVLSLSANIISGAGKAYKIYLNPTANHGVGAIIYVGGAGDLKVKTASGSIVTYTGIPAGFFVPVQVLRVYSTDTTATGLIANW